MATIDMGWAFNTFGVPGVLVFMFWRVLVFLKPIVTDKVVPTCETIAKKHIEFLDTTSGALTTMNTKIDNHGVQLDKYGQQLIVHNQKLNEIHSKITKE